MLALVQIVYALLSVQTTGTVVASPNLGCRCLYGESCWPSDSELSALASQLSQPLIYPVPPESACYPPSAPSGNCTDVLLNSFDGNWRANQSGSMQSPNFESYIFPNESISVCYLNATLGIPCSQGSVPPIGIDARSVEDVQLAVKFAKDHNLRLVVKNTGHDYLGRSTARGSFLIWTHNLKDIIINDAFIPEGAPSSDVNFAITLGAGVQWHEAYDAIHTVGRVLVGGIVPGGSIGAAGGWILGGGHSILSPSFGLGVDNVLEFTMVTAAADYLTVNAYQYPDLFFALRGGGGGTFGIVTSVTYRTHPEFPLIAWESTVTSANISTLKTFTAELVRSIPTLADDGWAGYVVPASSGFSLIFIAPNLTVLQANGSIAPLVAFAETLAPYGLEILSNVTFPFETFYSFYTLAFASGDAVGGNDEIGSRLLRREAFENDYVSLAEALLEYPGTLCLVAGGAVSKVDPDSMGLNPAWRQALVSYAFGVVWADGTPVSVIESVRVNITRGVETLIPFSADNGAYYNEASLFETDWQYTFFGSHYQKLKQIKEKYDPTGLFVVTEGVGSEDWDADLNCRI